MSENQGVVSRPLPNLEIGDEIGIGTYSLYATGNLADEGNPNILDGLESESVEEIPWNEDYTDEKRRIVYRGQEQLNKIPEPEDISPEEERKDSQHHFESDEIVGDTFDQIERNLALWNDGSTPDIPVYIGTSQREKTWLENKAWEALDRYGVYGGVDPHYYGGIDPVEDHDDRTLPTYFSGDAQMALDHSEGFYIGLIELSLPDLSEEREIFLDPEAAHLPEELGRSFVAMSGIPGNLIDRIHHFEEK